MSAMQFAPTLGHLAGPFLISLCPLLAHGQAALAPDLAAGVLKVALCQIVVAWHNAFNEITIRRADDLFACVTRDGRVYDLIPKGADLVQATLSVQLADSPGPHLINITPPRTLAFQNAQDAARLLPLLTRRGFSGGEICDSNKLQT